MTPGYILTESGREMRRKSCGLFVIILLFALGARSESGRLTLHGRLKVGKMISGKVGVGAGQGYRFRAALGDFIAVAYTQPGFTSILRITSEDGKEMLIERK